ncbi:MAG TPA: ABC transporter permease [Cytophagaceae bacterium]
MILSMLKIYIIASREFLTRIRKRSFLIMTLLGPIFFSLLLIVPLWLSNSADKREVVIVWTALPSLKNELHNTDKVEFVFSGKQNNKQAMEEFLGGQHDYYLLVSSENLEENSTPILYTKTSASFQLKNSINTALTDAARDLRLKKINISPSQFDDLKKKISVSTLNLGSQKESGDTGSVGLSVFLSVLIYFFIFLYGVQVMRGVLEEKTSRVVEVMISSVKPFQLMMGKILGIAAVSLCQFMIWLILSGTITSLLSHNYQESLSLFSNENIESTLAQTNDATQALEINGFINTFSQINFSFIISWFLFYFFGGYFLYSGLFAAAGAASDNETETQQFILPVTLPLIASLTLLGGILENPGSDLAFWLSLIPLTSPIMMMVRLPFGVPVWQLILSASILVVSFVSSVWVASKIYRIGILMYGKKISYREISKWLFY